MWLKSCIAVAVVKAGSYSFNSTHGPGTSYALGVTLKKKIERRKKSYNSPHCIIVKSESNTVAKCLGVKKKKERKRKTLPFAAT